MIVGSECGPFRIQYQEFINDVIVLVNEQATMQACRIDSSYTDTVMYYPNNQYFTGNLI